MGDYLKNTEQLSVRAEIQEDIVLPSGQKLQFERSVTAMAHRPNKFRGTSEGYGGRKDIWYNGEHITLFLGDKNLYAQAEAPGVIDEALDFAIEKYGLTMPLADLLVSEPYESAAKNIRSAAYLGMDSVRQRPCHHLAFRQDSIDWQIWVEVGETLLPRKLLITYKTLEGQPQFTAVFTEWSLPPRLPDLLFEFTPPEGVEKVEFLPSGE
jgi:hypothetical protein